jgi:hypothetical protein
MVGDDPNDKRALRERWAGTGDQDGAKHHEGGRGMFIRSRRLRRHRFTVIGGACNMVAGGEVMPVWSTFRSMSRR